MYPRIMTLTQRGIGDVAGLRWKKFNIKHVATNETAVTNMVATKYCPNKGMLSDVDGKVSATNRRNTVIAKRTVIPRPTFSPDSGGRKNLIRVNVEINAHGRIKLNT
jgi:hypothetical protein